MVTKLRLQDQHPALQAAVADPTVTLVYKPASRSYFIPILHEGYIPRRMGFPPGPPRLEAYLIYHCPFNGNLLPASVREQQIDRLLKQSKPNEPTFLDDARRLPKWAKSEDWWVAEEIGSVHDEEHLHEMKTAPPLWPYDNDLTPEQVNFILPGYRKSQDGPEHYCNSLSYIFSRAAIMFWYLPYTREYGPRIIDPNKRIDFQPIRILPVSYCPWCGTKLPKSKRPEWEAKVRKAGFDPENPEAEDFPEHLLRDKWWRNKKKKA